MKKGVDPAIYEGLDPEDIPPPEPAPEPEAELEPARPSKLRGPRAFVFLWTLAIVATVSAFCLHLAMRGRTVSLGYELGRARAEQARLREVKRVLEVESASYKTPERVDMVARTLLGMEPPSADRVIVLPAIDDKKLDKTASREAPP